MESGIWIVKLTGEVLPKLCTHRLSMDVVHVDTFSFMKRYL